MLKRSLTAAALLLSLGAGERAAARAFTVDDLLKTEGFGSVMFDPENRWLVFERHEPFLAMSRFDMLPSHDVLRSRLYRVDLNAPWRAVPLLRDPEPGVIVYGFSTDGSHLAVGRLRDDRWQLGIVTMASGAVRWLDLTPDYDPFYTTLAWRSPNTLVAITLSDGELPWRLRSLAYAAEALPERWQATRSGRASAVTVIGSGRLQQDGATAPGKLLVAIDAGSGEVRRLAAGRFLSVAMAPGGSHMALVEQGAAAPVPQDRAVSQADLPFRQKLALYDLQKHELRRPCGDCDLLWRPQWSPDGGHLAFVARRGKQDWKDAGLVLLSIADRSLAPLASPGIRPVVTEFPDGTARVAFHWRGTDLLLLARATKAQNSRADWYVVRRDRAYPLTSKLAEVGPVLSTTPTCKAAMSAADGIWCLDAPGPRRLFGSDVQISNGRIIGWKTQSGEISFRGDVLPDRAVRAGASERIEAIDVPQSGQMLLLRRSTDHGVKSLTLVSEARAETIATANDRLADIEPARVRKLPYRLADGRVAMGWLYLPPGDRDSRPLPLVVIPYPGAAYGDTEPAGQRPGAGRFYTSAQILAGRGYAVLLPSLPTRPFVTNEPPAFVEDTGRAVDAAVATGLIDRERVVLWGHSFGGYAVAMILANSCRYAAGIASAGVYDLAAVTGTLGQATRLAPEMTFGVAPYFAWAETGQGGLGVAPWTDPARYIAASPVYQAGRIRTPLLIVAADNDPSPLAGAEQLFLALARQEKDAELVTYWGEGHVVGSPANLRDFYVRIFNWLERTTSNPRTRCE
jgi:dipeptidyl aminopeptidase/acylaminoacyl peptidase